MEQVKQGWDFSRLPGSEHSAVIAAFDAGNIRALVDIHDKYKLSPYNYCCDQTGLLAWFGDAIKTGLIK